MPDIIQLLPDALANQIAAGEVVQRPASVVKELLENCIDAKSTSIELVIKDAGKALIQIIDNGEGMSETDARMSFERHATSKIIKTDDLFSIRTLGFRGEALASIAAVAQVELKTKREEDEIGTLIRIEGGEIKTQEPEACETGTCISVKNLFYNVPARRNFLKSNPVETKHILEEFQRVALGNPEIAMIFRQNDLETYNLPSEKLSKRIINLFGNNYKEQLIPCKEETEQLMVKGYVGKPEGSKKTRGEQYFFVNNRYIKSNYLHHAVKTAYENLIPDDHYPFYVLFLYIDPKHIDINVHPTKTEIKFDDERTTYAILHAAIKKALATHNVTPSLDFSQDINFSFGEREFSRARSFEPQAPSGGGTSFTPPSDIRDKQNLENWEKLYQNFERPINTGQHNSDSEEPQVSEIKYTSAASAGAGGEEVKQPAERPETSTFQIHTRYIAAQIKSGVVIVDQQAAHERILYEKYLTVLEKNGGTSQQFLFPQTVELNPADFELVQEMEQEIRALGFVFDIFGKNTIVVNGVPADVQNLNEKELFEGLIEQYKHFKSELKVGKKENLARALAKRASIKPGQKLSVVEMNTLIDQLFACKNPNYAPNGQQTIVVMDLERLQRLFK